MDIRVGREARQLEIGRGHRRSGLQQRGSAQTVRSSFVEAFGSPWRRRGPPAQRPEGTRWRRRDLHLHFNHFRPAVRGFCNCAKLSTGRNAIQHPNSSVSEIIVITTPSTNTTTLHEPTNAENDRSLIDMFDLTVVACPLGARAQSQTDRGATTAEAPIEDSLNVWERRLVQEGLILLGYCNGFADGQFAKGTRNAITDYQTQHNRAATGRLTTIDAVELGGAALALRDKLGWQPLADARAGLTMLLFLPPC